MGTTVPASGLPGAQIHTGVTAALPGGIVAALAALPGALAVAVGGSRATGTADVESDTDLYVVHRGAPAPSDVRAASLAPFADSGRVDESSAWGLENHLHHAGRLIEIMYLEIGDLEVTLDEAYGPGLRQEGYTTAFLHTLARSVVLRDEAGELEALRERLASYPEATRRRVVSESPEFLIGGTGYVLQLAKAQRRGDLPSVAHRLGKVVDVWFDLLFAVNRTYHPGEKRMLVHAAEVPLQPVDMVARWQKVLRLGLDDPTLVTELTTLTDDLVSLAVG